MMKTLRDDFLLSTSVTVKIKIKRVQVNFRLT